jgi:hypothetical protein
MSFRAHALSALNHDPSNPRKRLELLSALDRNQPANAAGITGIGLASAERRSRLKQRSDQEPLYMSVSKIDELHISKKIKKAPYNPLFFCDPMHTMVVLHDFGNLFF